MQEKGGGANSKSYLYNIICKVIQTQTAFIKNVLESSILWLGKRIKMIKT